MDTDSLDVRWLPSPFNRIKVRLALKKLRAGEIFTILIESGNPFNEISNEIKIRGCILSRIEKVESPFLNSYDYKLWVQKKVK